MKRSNCLFLSVIFFSSLSSFAQQRNIVQGDVYAIVVGISNYHYIKPLSYADRDAELFTQLLQSGTIGFIKPENLVILKNDSANAGNFWSSLSRLCNKKLKKGDRVYIYFAGHGDAIKGLNEYYLLLSDCQPANDGNNYLLSFGAIDMYHLKNRVGLLTAQGAEVVLVFDACRTNELPGGYASQAFNTSIIQANVGDIAMLATGPGQVSIEDVSFGHGHGLFTYNLVDALSGRADSEGKGNKDKVISLAELKEWVSNNVQLTSEKFHVLQNPVFCCEEKYNTVIGAVDSNFSISWNHFKELIAAPVTEVTANKALRSGTNVIDTGLLVLYNKFNTARKQNLLWGENSADRYYDQLAANFPGDPVTEEARYTLASDFINFAQQKINLYLEGKDLLSLEIMRQKSDSLSASGFLSDEYYRLQQTVSEKWTTAGLMIQKAGRLLSTQNDSSLLFQLKPKIEFLLARGYISQEKENKLNYLQALQYSLDAYKADSNAAYSAECLGLLYAYRHSFNHMFGSVGNDYEMGSIVRLSDTAMRYFRKAISLAPKWVSPYRSIALKIYGQLWYDSALVYLHKALLLNPDDGTTNMMIGTLYDQSKPDSALYYFRKAMTLSGKSSHAMIYRKMARVFLYPGYQRNSPSFRPDSVMAYSMLALAADSGKANDPEKKAEVVRDVYLDIATAYSMQGKNDAALAWYFKVVDLFPEHEWANRYIIRYYSDRNQSDSVFYYSKKLLQASPENGFALLEIAKYYENKKGFIDSAILYYEKNLAVTKDKDFSRERLAYLLMIRDKTNTRSLTYFTETMNEFPSGWRPYFNIACYYANLGDTGKAIEFLEKAFQKGMRSKSQVYSDPYLLSLHDTGQFKRLMAKYF